MAADDGMALGAYESLATNGIDTSEIQIYGINGLAEGCKGVIDGQLTGTVAHSAITFSEIIFDDLIAPYEAGTYDLLNATDFIEFEGEPIDVDSAEEWYEYFVSIDMAD